MRSASGGYRDRDRIYGGVFLFAGEAEEGRFDTSVKVVRTVAGKQE